MARNAVGLLALSLLVLPVTGCDLASTGPSSAAMIEAVSGNAQSGVVGGSLSRPLVVRVLNARGHPVESAEVEWHVSRGDGTVSSTMTLSSSDGTTSTTWILGTVAGGNEVTAFVRGVTAVSFTAEGMPGPPEGLASHEGADQTAAAGTAVPIAPAVRVHDAHGNGVPGISVTCVPVSGGGSVSSGTNDTDADGVATVSAWHLGTDVGLNELRCSTEALGAVLFTATSRAGPAESLTIEAGNGQTAVVATNVPTPPSVRVLDAHGNAVAGEAVTFVVTAGEGTVEGAAQTTDADGIATVGSWTLGSVSGIHRLSAEIAGGRTAEIVATAVAGSPATMTDGDWDVQSATVGTLVPTDPSVVVHDSFGNPVPGTSVIFTVTGGGGALTASGDTRATVTTDEAGRASLDTWTLGTKAGVNRLTAEVEQLEEATFSVEGTPDSPASLAAHAANFQRTEIGTAVAVPPSVRLVDQYGNPVDSSGIPVTFTVVSGGGELTGSDAVTLPDGTATVGSWSLGPQRGINEVTATAAGMSSATFEAAGLRVVDPFDSWDETLWKADSHSLGRGSFDPDNVTVSGGDLLLRLPAHTYDGGEIRSTETSWGGAYEARIKAAPPAGSLTAFFLYQSGTATHDEIDIEIFPDVGGKGPLVMFTTWVADQVTNHSRVPLDFDPAADFNTYLIVVRPESVRFYINDVLMEEFTSGVPTSPMLLMASAWWPNWLDEDQPTSDSSAAFDWIRY